MGKWDWFNKKYPRLPIVTSILGLVLGGYIDKTRDWALAKAMLTPYLLPALLVSVSLLWFFWSIYRPPRLEIICDASRHPFRQPFTVKGEHFTLLRVAVHNRSKFRAVERAEVKLTTAQPFMMDWVPARLRLMNEPETVREFFLAPDGIQYVDVAQYGHQKNLWLWHTVPNQDGRIEWKDYDITITVYGDNTDARHEVFVLKTERESMTIVRKVDKL